MLNEIEKPCESGENDTQSFAVTQDAAHGESNGIHAELVLLLAIGAVPPAIRGDPYDVLGDPIRRMLRLLR